MLQRVRSVILSHQVQQLLHVEGFADDPVGAPSLYLRIVDSGRPAGGHYHGRFAKETFRRRRNLPAGDAGHCQVREHNVEPTLLQQTYRLPSVGCQHHIVPAGEEDGAHGLADHGLVVDNQNVGLYVSLGDVDLLKLVWAHGYACITGPCCVDQG